MKGRVIIVVVLWHSKDGCVSLAVPHELRSSMPLGSVTPTLVVSMCRVKRIVHVGSPAIQIWRVTYCDVQISKFSNVGMALRQRTQKSCFLNLRLNTELGERVVPRLRKRASRGQRESGGGIHAT